MRRRSGALAASLLLLVLAALRLLWSGLLEQPLVPYSDQTFQAVLVQRVQDPDLYSRDAMVQAIDRFWPDPYFRVLAALAPLFPSLDALFSALTLLAALLFLGGIHVLGGELFPGRGVGFLAAWATAWVPRDTFVAEWAVIPVVPRMWTLAAAPWLLWLLRRARGASGLFLTFLGVGLLALVHSLSALQLCAVMLLCWGLGGAGPRSARGLLAAAGGAALGALPAVLALPPMEKLEPASASELAGTCFAYFVRPFPHRTGLILCQWGLLLLWILIGRAAWSRWRSRSSVAHAASGEEERASADGLRFVSGLALAAIGVALLHVVVRVTGQGLAFSPLRVTKYLTFALLLGAAATASTWMRSPGAAARAIGALGVLLLLLPVPERLYYLAWDRVPWLRRTLDASVASLPDIFPREDPGAEDLVLAPGTDWLELSELVESHLQKEELLLCPPRGGSLLRLHGRRSLFVLGEDSVVALYDRRTLLEFRRRFEAASRAYRQGAAAARRLALEEGCDWVLVPEGAAEPTAPRAAGWALVRPG